MHPTSLPGRHGIGDLGPEAWRFVDFLQAAGQTWWQMLPINPTDAGGAPYSATSAFAGNPLLVHLDALVARGWLDPQDLRPARGLRGDRVEYARVQRFKLARLRQAFGNFVEHGGLKLRAFERFCAEQADWLEHFALFNVLRRQHKNQPWVEWPRPLRARQAAALRQARADLADELNFERFVQFVFAEQWHALRNHAHERGIGLIGDIPIFVAHDSADVWANPDLFDLDARGHAKTVSGVPPDLFSRTGQRWGHPHYRWARHEQTRFAWWVARFAHTFAHFDAVRIDHFLGFNRVWSVPGKAKTALRGKWIKTPGDVLFRTLQQRLGKLPIVAEDLGLLVPEAAALRDKFGFPGMRLLHFAFGGDDGHYHEPDAFPRNCVVYPGTHDNDTTVGWFRELKREHARASDPDALTRYERVLRYTGTTGRQIHWDIMRLALMSVANTAIVPLQDLFGLGNEARMNLPGTVKGNWQWRFAARRLSPALAAGLRDLVEAYDRLPTDK